MTDKITSPNELTNEEREAVETLLFRLADDEYVTGERYIGWQVISPTIESDISIANIAQDELGHARLWYDLLQQLGYAERELLWEREASDFVHAIVTEQAYDDGDWADLAVRSQLYDIAEDIRLDAIADSRYAPIARRVAKVKEEEEYHLQHSRNWLERLVATEDGREAVKEAVDRRVKEALTIFAPVNREVEETIEAEEFRTKTLDEMEQEWQTRVEDTLDELGIEMPESDYDPDQTGRDRNHTDAWADLHADAVETYHALGRTEAVQLLDDPEL